MDLPDRPVVVAHRGASGHLPEHTLEAFRLAAALGADAIEVDVVCTADGVLLARHEADLGRTTDAPWHPELAARWSVQPGPAGPRQGWYADDLTLAEVRLLRARERWPHLRPHAAAHDGRFAVPTLDEVLALAAAEGVARGRPLGVVVEVKDAARLRRRGLPVEDLVAASVAAHRPAAAVPWVVLQSFEPTCLRRLARRTDVGLVQLVGRDEPSHDHPSRTPGQLLSPAGLREVSTYASGVGVHKHHLLGGWAATGGAPDVGGAQLAARVRSAGLLLAAWTFRDENAFLPPHLWRGGDPARRGNAAAEVAAALSVGVEVVFCDHPATALAVRDAQGAGRASGLPSLRS